MKKVSRIVRDVPMHWVGDGFPVRSLFSYNDGSAFDPFLLLDYGGPYDFSPGDQKRGVGEHPHRGFETVTIVYAGEVEHRDSSGSHGTIGPGDVQWMTAASGVVHEEFHSERFLREGGTFEMVQLWVNLPAKDKMTTPRYQGILSDHIPEVALPHDAGTGRVIAGELLGTRGPAKTFTSINVWDLHLHKASAVELDIPDGHNTMLIVQDGTVDVSGETIESVALVSFEKEGNSVKLRSGSGARVLLLSGAPLNEPIVGQGPFVMTTREEIQEAIADYRAGKMGRL